MRSVNLTLTCLLSNSYKVEYPGRHWPGRGSWRWYSSCIRYRGVRPEFLLRRNMSRIGGVRFVVATMVLSSAGILCAPMQGHGQDNPSAQVKDHGGRKIKTVIKPDYPAIARQMRVTGTVRLEATVTADGKVRDTKVIGGSP